MTYYRDFLEELVSHLRQNGVATPFIAGGWHPTTDCERVLEDENIDLVVLGEGEETLLELVTAVLAQGGAWPDEDRLAAIPGVAFRRNAEI